MCSAGCDNYPGLIITQCIYALHSINVHSYCADLKREGGGGGREESQMKRERQEVRIEPSYVAQFPWLNHPSK